MTPTQTENMEARLRAEVWRRTDEVELLRTLLSEATGLTLDGVTDLMALHRRASGVQSMEFTAHDVLASLGHRWWPTGVIARALLVNGGQGLTARQRSDHHHLVGKLLQQLMDDGDVEERRVMDDGDVVDRKQAGRGRKEYRRVAS